MIAGGTGLTPMLQVMRAVANNKEDHTNVSLLYANSTEQDILMRDELARIQDMNHNVQVHHIISRPTDTWTGLRGHINHRMIHELLPSPSKDVLILVCGPPSFHTTMTALLADTAYNDECIFHF